MLRPELDTKYEESLMKVKIERVEGIVGMPSDEEIFRNSFLSTIKTFVLRKSVHQLYEQLLFSRGGYCYRLCFFTSFSRCSFCSSGLPT